MSGVTKESIIEALGEPMLVSDADRQALARPRSFSPLWPRKMTPQTEAAEANHRPFTPRAQRCVELSLREALRLKHHCIEPEHILLGILREGSGFAC
jgi:Clp amino terminal domain, pathogenicity island component